MSASPQPNQYPAYSNEIDPGYQEDIEDFVRSLGWYWPEEVSRQAFDTALAFGKITMAITKDIENDTYKDPELRETFSKLGKVAFDITGILARNIPHSDFRRFEREHLKVVRAEETAKKTEPFWQETIERPPTRHGMLSDWLAASFIHFQGRPLSYDDLAKIVHAEDYDSVTKGRNNARIKEKVMSEASKKSLSQRLAPRGLNVRGFYSQYPSGTRKNVRLVCVPAEITFTRSDLDEAMRPTDDELRALAISLRQEEWDRVQTGIQDEMDKEWLTHEDSRLRFLKIKNRAAEKSLDKLDRAAARESKLALRQAKQELLQWELEEEYGSEIDDNPWGLTKTELAVLKRLPTGKSNKEIAQSLSLSPGAVNSSVHSLFRILSKFEIKDRVAASTLAYNEFTDEVSQHVSFVLEDINKLTLTEIRALESLSQGLTRFEIVQLNGVSESTLAGHIHGVYRKLGINRMQTGIFVQEARKAGLFDAYEEQLKNRRVETSKRSIRSSDDQEMDFDMGRMIDRGDRDLFRKRAYTAFFKVSKVLSEHDKPVKNLVLRIDNAQLLEDLVRRGIITRQQYEHGEIDRAAAVARTLIRADQDLGLLSADQVDEAMEIIREEEARYFQRFDEVDKRHKA